MKFSFLSVVMAIAVSTTLGSPAKTDFNDSVAQMMNELSGLQLVHRIKYVHCELETVMGSRSSSRIAAGVVLSEIKYGIDRHLIMAVIMNESNGNPMAYSQEQAVGIMQIRRPVWEKVLGGNHDWYDPVWNIQMGSEILHDLFNTYNSWHQSLSHYWSGSPSVKSSYSERVLQTWNRYNSTNLCTMYQDYEKGTGHL
ncbi:MAG: transglycosylase SLT domain-containing protein [candidate division NC10 bacterium]